MSFSKRTDRQGYSHWQALVKEILESTTIDANEPEEVRLERIARLEAEPEEWFLYYFPRFAFADPAPFHIAATTRVLHHPEWYEVRLWSRELAKSTRTMMEVLYMVLVGCGRMSVNADGTLQSLKLKKRCVLLISNSEDNAIRLLMPYKANLQYNQRIIQDYGPQEHPGLWQMGEFTTRAGASFRALGAGQSPRGTRSEEARPDVILFDDVDTDADCLNPTLISRKWHWIEEAAIGTRSVSKATTIIFCGNRIATDCCVERAAQHADHVDEINIRDAHGRSTWPQKNTEADIDRVLRQKSYAAQQKEYFNNPLTEGAVFSRLAFKAMRPVTEYSHLVCYTDPSYKDTADYKATVLVGRWQNEFHVIKCFVAQATTAQMINWHYAIMDLVGGSACYYFMEDVFMQDVLLKEVSDAGKKTGRNIPIRGDTRKKPDKFTRIESLLDPLHRNGQLYFNEQERDNPHMQCLADQFIAFAPGSRAHDDGPDAVEGAIWKIGEIALRAAGGIIPFRRPDNENRL